MDIEIEGIDVHTGTGGLGGVRSPPAHAVKGELKGRKEEMPKVWREGNMACSEGGNKVIFTGTDCPFGRIGIDYGGQSGQSGQRGQSG